MPHQVDLWLALLVGLSLLELCSLLRTPLVYGWTRALVFCFTLAFASAGLFYGFKPVFLALALTIQLVFILVPAMVISKLGTRLLVLDLESARSLLPFLHLFLWARPYQFVFDRVASFQAYMRGDQTAGDAAMLKWQGADSPRALREQAQSTMLNGRILGWDWPGTIALFEQMKSTAPPPKPLWLWVSRAYSELGQVPEAARSLNQASLAEYTTGAAALSLALLPFFALCGAIDKTEVLLEVLRHERVALPDFARAYWLARCLAIAGNRQKALETYEGALVLLDGHKFQTSAWRSRIERQMGQLKQDQSEAQACQSKDYGQIEEQVWTMYQNARFVQEIVSPRRRSIVVVALVALTVLVFVVLKLMMVSGSDEQIVLVQELMGIGLLDPRKVLAGQYWRLVTYMFLHKDEVHLLMNMIGLFWFGRVAENIFGTARFVGIFFLAGIVGGIIHCLFQPAELVVGDSGAVMGIFAAVGAGIFRLREYLPARTRHNELSWLVGLALASFFIDQIMPQVASVVHLGGMLAGLSFGFIVSVPRPPYVRAL